MRQNHVTSFPVLVRRVGNGGAQLSPHCSSFQDGSAASPWQEDKEKDATGVGRAVVCDGLLELLLYDTLGGQSGMLTELGLTMRTLRPERTSAPSLVCAELLIRTPQEPRPSSTSMETTHVQVARRPHPDKIGTGGEDAHYISPDQRILCVFDGVGGWSYSVSKQPITQE